MKIRKGNECYLAGKAWHLSDAFSTYYRNMLVYLGQMIITDLYHGRDM